MNIKLIAHSIFYILFFLLFYSKNLPANMLPKVLPKMLHPLSKATEDFKYSEYFEIKKQNADVDLLLISQIHSLFPLPVEKYDRNKHFGGWIQFKDDDSCLDTRGLVLERDSKKPVTVANTCHIKDGEWFDPYTDQSYFSAADIQIDHVVALKNTYMTGAYEWSFQKRCLYANYMGFQTHLLPVYGAENIKKGDKSPREYIPPNEKYVCSYLKNWLSIKYIWSLRLTPTEIQKINEFILDYKCEKKEFTLSKEQINDQNNFIQKNENLCASASLLAF